MNEKRITEFIEKNIKIIVNEKKLIQIIEKDNGVKKVLENIESIKQCWKRFYPNSNDDVWTTEIERLKKIHFANETLKLNSNFKLPSLNVSSFRNKIEQRVERFLERFNSNIEYALISLVSSLPIAYLMGSIFSEHKYYNLYKGQTVETDYENSDYYLDEYNYIVFLVSCVVIFCLVYLYILSVKRRKL
jgi:hypothetical protein